MALVRGRGGTPVEPLMPRLETSMRACVWQPQKLLGEIGDRGAVEHLIGVLGSGSRAVEIRKAGGRFSWPRSVTRAQLTSLSSVLKDASWSVRSSRM